MIKSGESVRRPSREDQRCPQGSQHIGLTLGRAGTASQTLRGSQLTVQLSTSDDGMVGPLTNTLSGFAAQYQRAVQAQQRR